MRLFVHAFVTWFIMKGMRCASHFIVPIDEVSLPRVTKTKLEREWQPKLKKEIRRRFPGCYIFKLDSGEFQGIPDLLILFQSQWAILEVKRGLNAKKQPNQDWYVDEFNKMSFSAFVNPQNQEAVLNDLERAFTSRGEALVS